MQDERSGLKDSSSTHGGAPHQGEPVQAVSKNDTRVETRDMKGGDGDSAKSKALHSDSQLNRHGAHDLG